MNHGYAEAFFVYILASKPHGVLYIGMSSDLTGRVWQHRDRVLDGFTKRYWVNRLVYYEFHATAESAQRREYLMKRWRRDWKIKLIEASNPTWADLYAQALEEHGFEI